MLVHQEKLVRTLVLVRELEEQMQVYCLDGKQTPVPWQNVAMAVEAYTGDRIAVVRPTVEDLREINGMMVRWDDGFVAITVRPGLGSALANYTIVKEAMHPLIDTKESRSPEASTTIECLFKSSFFMAGEHEGDHEAVVQSEHLAAIAAAAILVPASIRQKILDDIKTGKTTIAKEAIELDVPEHVVSIALSDAVMECTALAAQESIAA